MALINDETKGTATIILKSGATVKKKMSVSAFRELNTCFVHQKDIVFQNTGVRNGDAFNLLVSEIAMLSIDEWEYGD